MLNLFIKTLCKHHWYAIDYDYSIMSGLHSGEWLKKNEQFLLYCPLCKKQEWVTNEKWKQIQKIYEIEEKIKNNQ